MSDSSGFSLSTEDDATTNLLVIIIDCDTAEWKLRSEFAQQRVSTIDQLIRNLVIFCNSYAVMSRSNRLLVLGNHDKHLDTIVPLGNPVLYELPQQLCHGILKAAELSQSDVNKANNGQSQENNDENNVQSSLANALSVALCVINKQIAKHPIGIQARILVIQLKPDIPQTYNAVMNCVFSAQKLNVPIDSIVLSQGTSNFLQQACFLTKGIYQHIEDQRDTLQILLTHFLASPSTRRQLHVPLQKTVEFKASCMCHRKIVEFAMMCSVCLSLICDIHSICPTCSSPVRQAKTTVTNS